MQSTAILVLVASCFIVLATSEEVNQIHERQERSSDVFVDGTDAAATNEDRNLFALAAKNQNGDNASIKFDGYTQQGIEDDGDDVLSSQGNGDVLANVAEGFNGPLLSKRFNEFVGKRSGISEDKPIVSSAEGMFPDSLNEILVSLPKLSQEQLDSGLLDKNGMDNTAIRRLMHDLYGELLNDRVSKREYEFVGKRNYDFVGKKRYDFLGKRTPYNFLGKRSYDFVGKRSPYDFVGKRSPYDFVGKRSPYDFVGKRSPYDFVGKRSPYDFVGKRSPYDFVGKRSPYEFVGKKSQDIDDINASLSLSPYFPTDEFPRGAFSYNNGIPVLSSQSTLDFGNINKRYSEFLGKKKRNEEHEDATLSNTERLAALLQNNGLRKRLSRMLLNRRLDDHYPGFVGK